MVGRREASIALVLGVMLGTCSGAGAVQRQLPECLGALQFICPKETLGLRKAAPDVNCLHSFQTEAANGGLPSECCDKTSALLECWKQNLPSECVAGAGSEELRLLESDVTRSCESPSESVQSPDTTPTAADTHPIESLGSSVAPFTKSPRKTPSTSPSPVLGSDGSNSCFPGIAIVQLEDGSIKTMNELVIGDRILSSSGYSPVYFFSHRLSRPQSQFVVISTGNGAAIELSPSHYLPVGVERRLVAAKDVVVGDFLWTPDERLDVVTQLSHVGRSGLFNPHTVAGDIIVNGVVASCYTTALHPVLASFLLAPMRLTYEASSGRIHAPEWVFNIAASSYSILRRVKDFRAKQLKI